MTPAEQIRLTVEALNNANGRGGQTRLARLLPVNGRTVRRWLAGKATPHPVVLEKIVALRGRMATGGERSGV